MLLYTDWLCWLLMPLLVFIVYLVYMSWHFRLFSKQGVPVNGTPIPILGTFGRVMRGGQIEGIEGDLEKYGKTHGAFVGRNPTLTTIDADIIREVFIRDNPSFPERFSFRTGDITEDLMLSNIGDYDHWKALRSIMSPTFSSGKLKRMMKQINKCAAIYAGHLAKESAEGKSLEMKDFAGSFSMDVIASTAFGLDVNSQADHNNPFVKHAFDAFKMNLTHPVLLVSFFCPCLAPLMTLLKLSFLNRNAKDFFIDIANQALDSRKESEDEGNVDFLQLMANAHKEDGGENKGKKAMTRQEIISQALLFFLAGYDTTASTIAFLAYNLACNPDCQDKLIEEVKNVVGDKEEVTDEDLHKMPYLDMCVSESLRLFSPGVRVDRMAHRDVVLKGIHLPKGSYVMVPVYHMHRFPEIYPQPDAFIPERFSPKEKAKRDPMHYMPFGAGPRQCLATRFALLEVKIATVHVLRTQRFVKAPETPVPAKVNNKDGLIKMENGIWLKVEKHADI